MLMQLIPVLMAHVSVLVFVVQGRGGECHEEQQVAAQAALFGQERQNGVGRVLGEKGFQSPACFRHHLEIISSFYSHNYYVNVLHTDRAFLLRT